MRWRDEGIILSLRPQGESGVVLSLLTDGYGRHLGFHRGSGAKAPWRQPGTRVIAGWNSRSEGGLGYWALEPAEAPALRHFGAPPKLLAISAATAFLDGLLPERMPVPEVYEAALLFIDGLGGNEWLEHYGRLEECLLRETGLHPGGDFGEGLERLNRIGPALTEAAKSLGKPLPVARTLLISALQPRLR